MPRLAASVKGPLWPSFFVGLVPFPIANAPHQRGPRQLHQQRNLKVGCEDQGSVAIVGGRQVLVGTGLHHQTRVFRRLLRLFLANVWVEAQLQQGWKFPINQGNEGFSMWIVPSTSIWTVPLETSTSFTAPSLAAALKGWRKKSTTNFHVPGKSSSSASSSFRLEEEPHGGRPRAWCKRCSTCSMLAGWRSLSGPWDVRPYNKGEKTNRDGNRGLLSCLLRTVNKGEHPDPN